MKRQRSSALNATKKQRRTHKLGGFRPSVEALENRIVLAAPDAIGFDPAPGSHDAQVSTGISITYDEQIDTGSVNDSTFVVHSRQLGQMLAPPSDYSVSGNTASWTQPFGVDLFPGELVQVTSTTGIESGGDNGNRYVFQFRVGPDGGSGFFQKQGLGLGSSDSYGVAIGDFDNDADLDAFVANHGAANRIYRNDGNGNFSDTGQLLGNNQSQDVALGDLDGDGDLDAFVANTSSQGNRVYRNIGGSVFVDTGQSLGARDSRAVALGDFDGDGDLDAFVANSANEGNRVYLNDGNGSFNSNGQNLGNSNSFDVDIADLDDDGDLDAFVANSDSQANRVWINNGSGSFTNNGQKLGNGNSRSVSLGDVDGDGNVDAFVGNGSPNRVWLNNGAASFSDSGQSLGDGNTRQVELVDVDADGDLDAWVANASSQVWFNSGGGAFVDSGQNLNSSDHRSVAFGDLNDDGSIDAFVGNDGGGNQVWINLLTPPISSDVFEPNNSLGNATDLDTSPFNLGDQLRIEHNFLSINDNDEDWFEYTAPEDGTLTVQALFSHALGDVDIFLHNSSGSQIASSVSSTDNETITRDVNKNDRFFVRVKGAGSSGVNPNYTLVVQGSQYAPDKFVGANGNHTDETAVSLGTASQVHSNLTIHNPGRNDHFKLHAAQNGTLSVSIDFIHAQGDLDLQILDSNDNEVAISESASDNEDIEFFGVLGTTYTVKVFGFENATNPNYSLSIDSGNSIPSISNIGTQNLNEDQPSGTIGFTVNDAETPSGSLLVTAVSADQTLIPNSNLNLGGSGSSRNIRITPAENRSGSTEVTVTVTDSNGGTRNEIFTVNVAADADTPFLSASDASGGEGAPIPLNISASLRDIDGSETLTITVANVPAGASLNRGTNNFDGSWTLDENDLNGLAIQPPNNFDGSFTLNLTATATESLNNDTATATATLRVSTSPIPDAPQLILGNVSGNEDSPIPLNITANLVDNDGSETLSILFEDVPDGSTFSAGTKNPDGTWTMTQAQISGLTYTGRLHDDNNVRLRVTAIATEIATGETARNTKLQNVSIAAVADAPILTAANVEGEEGSAIPLAVTVSLVDTDGSEELNRVEFSGLPSGSTMSRGSSAGGGRWRVDASDLPGLTLTLPSNFDDDVTITVSAESEENDNGDTAETIRTFDVTFNAVADPPILVVSDAEGDENTAIPLSISASLSDTDGSETLTVEITNVPSGATLSDGTNNGGGKWTINPDDLPNLKITPPLDDPTDFTLTVRAIATEMSNGDNTSVTDTLQVTVMSNNANPTISSLANITIDEDTTTGTIMFTVDDAESGPNGVTVTAASSNQVKVPDGNIVVGGTGANRTVHITPAPDQVGTVPITLTARDDEGGVATEIFALTIRQINDPPTITGLVNQTTNEDVPSSANTFTVSDVDSAADDFVVVGTSSNQSLVRNANIVVQEVSTDGDHADYTVTVTPEADQSGSVSITISADDGEGGVRNESFTLTINPVNDPPTVIDPVGGMTVNEDSPDRTIDLGTVFRDADGVGDLSFTVRSNDNPSLVNTSISGSTLTLDFVDDASGHATVRVRATDSAGAFAEDTITMIVNNVNDAPTITPPGTQNSTEDDIIGPLPVTIVDPDSDLSLSDITVTSSNTSLIPNGNIVLEQSASDGTTLDLLLTLTPASNASGMTTITIGANDNDGAESEASFIVNIGIVNDDPTITAINDQVIDEDSSTGSLSFSVDDEETSAGNLVVSATSNDQSLVPDGNITLSGTGTNRTVTVQPAADANGMATVTLEVRDENGATATTSFHVDVTPVNDVPLVTDPFDDLVVDEDAPNSTFDLDTVFQDPDDDLTFTVINSNPGLVDANEDDGILTLSYQQNQNGTADITVRATDSAGEIVQSPFEVTVNSINDAPVNQLPGLQMTNKNTPLVLSMANGNAITISDVDANGDDIAVVLEVDDATLKLATTSGLSTVLGDGTRSLAITGPLSGINNALDGLTFRPNVGFDGMTTLSIETDDQGHGGAGGPKNDQDMLAIMVLSDSNDIVPPTVQIVDVSPDPRAQVVDTITVQFSEPVAGFNASDLTLRRRANANDVVSLASATLTTNDNITYQLGNLSSLTGASGIYTLALNPANSGIHDLAANNLVVGDQDRWVNGAGDTNEDREFNQFDIIKMLQGGKYLTGLAATWMEGDFDGNGVFNQHDIILTQQTRPSHYLQGPFAATAQTENSSLVAPRGVVSQGNDAPAVATEESIPVDYVFQALEGEADDEDLIRAAVKDEAVREVIVDALFRV